MLQKGYSVLFIAVLFLKGSHQTNTSSTELLQVSVVTRHGARGPSKPIPGDPFTDPNLWPNGWMQLTDEGVRQMKELGAWTKQRYSSFLPEKYIFKHIEARSTETGRTLASASAFLEGLYPGASVPVFSAPLRCDVILSSHKSCPEYVRQESMYVHSKEFYDIEKKWFPTYAYLSKNIGREVKHTGSVEALYSRFIIGKRRGLELPAWSKGVFPDPMKSIAVFHTASGSSTTEMARLRYGPLLNQILNPSAEKEDKKLFLLYSAHDFTIAGLLKAMGVFDETPVDFAAMVIFETYKNGSVKILYKNSDDAVVLKLKGCGEVCDGNEIVNNILKPILPVNRDEECLIKRKPLDVYSPNVMILLSIALAAAAFGAITVICVSRTFKVDEKTDNNVKCEYHQLKGNNIAERYMF